jgi:hypothetical protein
MSSPPELALLHPRRSSPPAMSSPPRLPCWTPASSALLDHCRLRPASPAPALPCLPRAAMAGKLGNGRGRQARGGAGPGTASSRRGELEAVRAGLDQ